MNRVLQGINKHHVILLRGDSVRNVLKESVYSKYPHVAFSSINMDLKRVAACLESRRWDGTRPILVLFRCEEWMKELSILIRNRHPSQAVIMVTDGEYTTHTPLMKSLADTTVVIGTLPTTIFSLLKNGPLPPSGSRRKKERKKTDELENESLTGAEARYNDAIRCTSIHSVMDQIHHSQHGLESSEALSDMDIYQHRVPEDVLVNLMPVHGVIEYTCNKKVESKTASNTRFLRIVTPIVALSRLNLMSTHETMEYIRYAHQIKISPGFSQCPRDDVDLNFVKNVNDRIRLFAHMGHSSSRTAKRIRNDPTAVPDKLRKIT
jgi:hypothetical protein